ncbi:MAG: T9SS type A sorting domain-containing protein [Flavobacteriales bacterium]|jgi:hypothetical protein|nr:T9SS type A sorting domain-containing protein [Flavobacteriales bacterium]MBP8878693.1 T9SS type A sorting domain-containing protein [Flavobacteriales bacterium]
MKTILFAIASLISITSSACCDVIAATITYEPLGESTYRISVEVFTCLSAPSDHPEIWIDFGADAVSAPRVEIFDDPASDLRRSIYQLDHTFLEPGVHVINATIGNRAGGIVNIPNSISQTLCVEALVHIDPELGPNHSIRFNTPPTQVIQNWNTFSYQPDPTDMDGDSLVFEMVAARGLYCQPILGYSTLTGVNVVSVDPTNGTFIWDYPPFNGEFNLTIQGSEYRNGQLIGQMTRDMAICVVGFIAGVGEGETMDPFTIHPTLATDQVWIDAQGIWSIAVLDAAGRMVLQPNNTRSTTPIVLSSLVAGAYTLLAMDGDGRFRTARFVKGR